MTIPAGNRRPHPRPAGIAGPCLASLLAVLTAAGNAHAGSVHGLVHLTGPAPERPTIFMTADPACDKIFPHGRPAEVVVADATGSLANVIVYVKSGLPDDFQAPPPPTAAQLDQKGCAYVPHVLAVRTGQEIEIHNADETFHNVDARSHTNVPFNEAMPGKDLVIRKAFPRSEVAVKLKCDIHPWMSAYIGVFDHPFFAVTGADGTFSIPGLPKGEYVIEAWHESLGLQSAKVKVGKDDTATVDFSFAGN